MSSVYILKLGGEKWYVGRVDDGFSVEDRMALYRAGKGSKWVQRYGFVECTEVFVGEEFSEVTTTLRLMKKYGIDNVRGGPWNAASHYGDNFIAQQIKRILESVYNSCHLCGVDGHYSYFCPSLPRG
jgi:predicted GIY-YIG superfamily endonuclease